MYQIRIYYKLAKQGICIYRCTIFRFALPGRSSNLFVGAYPQSPLIASEAVRLNETFTFSIIASHVSRICDSVIFIFNFPWYTCPITRLKHPEVTQMAGKERKGYHQKLKMLYLAKIFSEETDDQHTLTMPEIIEKLALYGVNADRKTLYLDFDELRDFGLDIVADQVGRNCYYNLGNRDFELPELKLLVDSVQSAKFITDKKSKDLIRKLESLVSKYEAKQLHRQVIISGRVKTMNESIYYNVDKIHDAINAGCQIRFKYFQWNVKKEMELRKDGAWYQISPWALMWDDEYYYLVAYDAVDNMIKHYRVDKMIKISVVDEKRKGQEIFKKFNTPRYSKSLFGMNSGEEVGVTLEAANHMAGILIDRFGKDIFIVPVDEDHFRTNVNVTVSSPFLGWIMSLGQDIRIIGPQSVVDKMTAEAQRLAAQYPPTVSD